VLSRVVWWCCVRVGKRFALKLVRPVGFCVVLSGSVRLQNVCKGRLVATSWVPDSAGAPRPMAWGSKRGEAPRALLGEVGGAVVRVDGTADV
jgi:hypothetical protein